MANYPFTYRTLDALREDIEKLNLSIPVSEDLSVLKRTVTLHGGKTVLENRLLVHPMEGFDSDDHGAPSDLTLRRYNRFATSGAAMGWCEAVSVCPEGRSNRHQLLFSEENLDGFKRLVEEFHEKSDGKPIIAQLTHSGRFSAPDGTLYPLVMYKNPLFNNKFRDRDDIPLVTDEYLDSLEEQYLKAADIAVRAGFDGIDIKACHKYLLGESLAAYEREGKYGGTFENRTRLFLSIIRDIRESYGKSVFLASRFNLYDAMEYPYGFGCDREDPMKPDYAEIGRLIAEMKALDIEVINVTMGTPYLTPHINRPHSGGEDIPENPLIGADRMIRYTAEAQRMFPDVTFVGAGYSFFRQFAPYVAAGAIESGMISMVGFGRMAFAYPDFARDMLAGTMQSAKSCLTCSKCTELMRTHHVTGCPIRDSALYMPLYQKYVLGKES